MGAYVCVSDFLLAVRPLQELLNSKVIQDLPASSVNIFARLWPVGLNYSRQTFPQAVYLRKYPISDCWFVSFSKKFKEKIYILASSWKVNSAFATPVQINPNLTMPFWDHTPSTGKQLNSWKSLRFQGMGPTGVPRHRPAAASKAAAARLETVTRAGSRAPARLALRDDTALFS